MASSQPKLNWVKEMLRLSRLSKRKLRVMVNQTEGLYNGKELTKAQMIFELIFLVDAPEK